MGTADKVKSSSVYGTTQKRYVYKPLPKLKCKNCK